MMGSKLILAGDIGGTKTRLGIFTSSRGNVASVREATYASREYGSLEEIIEEFLGHGVRVDAACFGVAGPVVDGAASPTNLTWQMKTAQLKRKLPTGSVELINDLVANAYGLQALE